MSKKIEKEPHTRVITSSQNTKKTRTNNGRKGILNHGFTVSSFFLRTEEQNEKDLSMDGNMLDLLL